MTSSSYLRRHIIRISSYFIPLRNLSSKSRLKDLLLTMPKDTVHVPKLKEGRSKKKAAFAHYPAGIINLQVLGNGSIGAPRALYVFTDQTKYLFNCGEGTQRLAHEHRMKLAKLEHIFITNNTWDNTGGLPGVALTIQDIGVPEITLHGPPKTEKLFEGTRRFVVLKDLKIKVANIEGEGFRDTTMHVDYVRLLPSSQDNLSEKSTSSEESNFEEDETDYYAPIKGCKRNLEITNEAEEQKKRTKVDVDSQESSSSASVVGATGGSDDGPSNIVMCYVCRPTEKKGTLLIEKCVEFGVPAGPLLGKLKSGEDVTLADGKIVKAKDVRSPDCPGPVFIVVDCPDERYIDSLTQNPILNKYHDPSNPDDFPHVIAHFTPSQVMLHPKYREWMGKFRITTKHLLLNDSCTGMGSEAVHRIQHKLGLLDKDMFPPLNEDGVELFYPSSESEEVVTNKLDVLAKPEALKDLEVPIIMGTTLMKYCLRPFPQLDNSSQLIINPEENRREVFENEEFPPALETLKEKMKSLESQMGKEVYPEFTFLGTGSCIPNKTRNTSGILVQTDPDSCLIMDCGEGTYGQLVRIFGPSKVNDILSKLKVIYVSHLHADHHIGLIQLIRKRWESLKRQGIIPSPVYLLAPFQIQTWLYLYNKSIERIKGAYQLVPNQDLRFNLQPPSQDNIFLQEVKHLLGLTDIKTTYVRHCPNAFGIALTHSSGWKITYSGDTMPCDDLVKIGMDSDVLIHEATMEDDLKKEAVIKMHSTTSEAIQIGHQMNAKFILLTHFSQRYAKVPVINESFGSNVGIAFDNMRVRRCDLPKIPLMYDALNIMFNEDVEEMEIKTSKRQKRKEFEQMTTQSISQKTSG